MNKAVIIMGSEADLEWAKKIVAGRSNALRGFTDARTHCPVRRTKRIYTSTLYINADKEKRTYL